MIDDIQFRDRKANFFCAVDVQVHLADIPVISIRKVQNEPDQDILSESGLTFHQNQKPVPDQESQVIKAVSHYQAGEGHQNDILLPDIRILRVQHLIELQTILRAAEQVTEDTVPSNSG